MQLTSSQSILKNLLEAQELENTQVDRRVQSETTLIRTKGGVELDTEAAVDLELALVVFPDYTEVDDAFGDGGDFKGGAVFGVFLEEGGVFEGGGELWWWERSALVFSSG